MTTLENVPYLDQYFGNWACWLHVFHSLHQQARNLKLDVHMASHAMAPRHSRDLGPAYSLREGVATVELRGALMKHVSSLFGGTSTVEARRAIRAAAGDDRARSIMLLIDSPGGTVAGTQALAADVAAAAARKPVAAMVEDLCASAAYWVGSQATKVYATPSSLVGSIGTFAVVHDASKGFEQEGVKAHIIRAGEFKGAGTWGTEVTDKQLAEFQRVVNGLNDQFLADVSKGRNRSLATVTAWGDGRIHLSEEAVKLGLVDAVQSVDATFQQLRDGKLGSPATPPPKSTAGPTSAAAYVPPAPPAKQQESEMSAKDQFEAAVQQKMASGMTRQKATAAVVKENPALHQKMLRETNQDRPAAHCHK